MVTGVTMKKPSSKTGPFAPGGDPRSPFYLPSPSISHVFATTCKTSLCFIFKILNRVSFTGTSINCQTEHKILSNTNIFSQSHCKSLGWKGPECALPVFLLVIFFALFQSFALFSSEESGGGLVRERGSTPFGSCSRIPPRSCFGRLCFPRWVSGAQTCPEMVCGREGCVQPAFVNAHALLQGTRVGPHPFVCISHTALDLAYLGNPI